MMQFHFTANCRFEADDLPHAWRLLAEHFTWLGADAQGESPLPMLPPSELHLHVSEELYG